MGEKVTVRPGWWFNDWRNYGAWPRTHVKDDGRLDRSNRPGRSSIKAKPATRCRTQRGHLSVGLGRSKSLPPRGGVDRSKKPNNECQRSLIRCPGVEC